MRLYVVCFLKLGESSAQVHQAKVPFWKVEFLALVKHWKIFYIVLQLCDLNGKWVYLCLLIDFNLAEGVFPLLILCSFGIVLTLKLFDLPCILCLCPPPFGGQSLNHLFQTRVLFPFLRISLTEPLYFLLLICYSFLHGLDFVQHGVLFISHKFDQLVFWLYLSA